MRLPLFANTAAALGFAMSCCATAIRAQDTTKKSANVSSSNTSTKYCWRGQPKPACNGFLLTEFGFFRSVVQPTAQISYSNYADSTQKSVYLLRAAPWNFTWEVGGMVNTTARSAVGATILLGVNSDGGTVGVKGRYRRWLNPDGIALDVGVGVRTTSPDLATFTYEFGAPYREPGPSPAFTADIAINGRDYVALVARVDVERFGARYQPNVALGVRAGSKPAAIGTGALMATYAVLLSIVVVAFGGGDW